MIRACFVVFTLVMWNLYIYNMFLRFVREVATRDEEEEEGGPLLCRKASGVGRGCVFAKVPLDRKHVARKR